MGKFNKGGFGGDRKGRGSFGGDRGNRGGFGGGDRGGRGGFGGGRGDRPDMHRATCSECGKGCEVPFRPTGDKPVFCSDCFESKRDGGNDRGGRNFEKREQPRFSRDNREEHSSVNYKPQLEQINATLTKILALLSPKQEEKVIDTAVTLQNTEKKARREKPAKKTVDTKALAKTIEKVTEKKKVVAKKAPVVKKKAVAKKK